MPASSSSSSSSTSSSDNDFLIPSTLENSDIILIVCAARMIVTQSFKKLAPPPAPPNVPKLGDVMKCLDGVNRQLRTRFQYCYDKEDGEKASKKEEEDRMRRMRENEFIRQREEQKRIILKGAQERLTVTPDLHNLIELDNEARVDAVRGLDSLVDDYETNLLAIKVSTACGDSEPYYGNFRSLQTPPRNCRQIITLDETIDYSDFTERDSVAQLNHFREHLESSLCSHYDPPLYSQPVLENQLSVEEVTSNLFDLSLHLEKSFRTVDRSASENFNTSTKTSL